MNFLLKQFFTQKKLYLAQQQDSKKLSKVTIDNIITNAQDNCINFHDAIDAYLPSTKAGAIRHRLEMVSKILKTPYTKCSDIINDVLFLTEYKTELINAQTEETEENEEA